jgi:cell division protein FtsW (lipid II flippase)
MTESPARRTSLTLLLFACLVVFVARLVAAPGPAGGGAVTQAAGLALGLLAVGGYLRLRLPPHDPLLYPTVALLVGLGGALLSALKPPLADKQLVWTAIGMATLAAAAGFRHWRRVCDYPYVTMALAGGLLLLTSVAGKPLGAGGDVKLGIDLGLFSFQPSELARLALVFFLAGYLAEKQALLARPAKWWSLGRADLKYLGPLLVMWGLCLLLLVSQRDLGAALLYFSLFIAMLYLATARLPYVALGLGAFALGAAVCYRFLPVVATRLNLWLDPWADPQNKGYQIVQGLFSLSAGGNWGTGLGVGDAGRIPAVHTDLIFAAVGEQLGLVGALSVLLCYAVLVYRGYRIAIAANDEVPMLLAAGLTTALALQTFVIIGGVVKLTPLTGVTLPFLSYGGTSMLVNSLSAGILLALSTQRTPA